MARRLNPRVLQHASHEKSRSTRYASDLGKAFGAIATIESTGQLLWALAVDQLYKAAIGPYPPAVFLFGSGLCALSFGILAVVARDRRPGRVAEATGGTLNENEQ